MFASYDEYALTSVTLFTHLVTVPENILSIIFWEMAGKYETRDYIQSSLRQQFSQLMYNFFNTCKPFSQIVNPV